MASFYNFVLALWVVVSSSKTQICRSNRKPSRILCTVFSYAVTVDVDTPLAMRLVVDHDLMNMMIWSRCYPNIVWCLVVSQTRNTNQSRKHVSTLNVNPNEPVHAQRIKIVTKGYPSSRKQPIASAYCHITILLSEDVAVAMTLT